jgi:methylphosphotriester-DNA--protein-cysteine methyltransferase
MTNDAGKTWTLIGADGEPYESDVPGAFGGNRKSRVYGRFDCRSARQALAKGGYVANRVFFPDEATAVAAGYRPCGTCMPNEWAEWKAAHPA